MKNNNLCRNVQDILRLGARSVYLNWKLIHEHCKFKYQLLFSKNGVSFETNVREVINVKSTSNWHTIQPLKYFTF